MSKVTLEVETDDPSSLAADLREHLGTDTVRIVAERFPGAPGETPDTVFGLELSDPLPDGWTPLEALVAIRCLTGGGDGVPPVQLHWSPTRSLPSWEASGMCDYLRHQIRLCWGSAVVVLTDEDDGPPDT